MRSRPLLRAATAALLVVMASACTLLSGAGDLRVAATEEEEDAAGDGSVVSAPDGRAPDGGRDDAHTPADGSIPPLDAAGCTTTGVRYATVATGAAWKLPEEATGPPDKAAAEYDPTSQPLVTGGYGFALPAPARVVGIVVTIRRASNGFVSPSAVTLRRGANRATGAGWPLASDLADVKYGSPSDTWDVAWTATDVNAGTFGVQLTLTGFGTAGIDSVGIEVHYCN